MREESMSDLGCGEASTEGEGTGMLGEHEVGSGEGEGTEGVVEVAEAVDDEEEGAAS